MPPRLAHWMAAIERRLKAALIQVVPPLRLDRKSGAIAWDGPDAFVALITGAASGAAEYPWTEQVPAPVGWVSGVRAGTLTRQPVIEANGQTNCPPIRVSVTRGRNGKLYFWMTVCDTGTGGGGAAAGPLVTRGMGQATDLVTRGLGSGAAPAGGPVVTRGLGGPSTAMVTRGLVP